MGDLIAQLETATIVQLAFDEAPNDGGLGALREIAAQLPAASSVAPGTMVAVSDRLQGTRKLTMFQRMTGRAAPGGIERAARCTALLARGYVRVGGGVTKDKVDWAWGFAPSRG